MRYIKIIIIYVLSFIILLAAVLYSAFLFLFPTVINSDKNISKLETLLYDKTGINLILESLEIKTTPSLVLNLKSQNISLLDDDNVEILNITNLAGNIDLKRFSNSQISAGDVKINACSFPLKHTEKKSKKSSHFDLSKLPEITVNSIEYTSENEKIDIQNLKLDKNILSLTGILTAPFLQNPVKIGEQGYININGNSVAAENFLVTLGSEKINIDGKLFDKHSGMDFNIKGNNLPVNDIEKMLLYYQKSQDPAKKFIENFKDYAGNINLDINVTTQGFFGKAVIKDLKASTVLFDIPIYFKKADLNFLGKSITSEAKGILGGENIFHTLEIVNLGTPDKEVTGVVTANLTGKFKYIPNLTILNSVDAKVIYNIKNQKIDIKYFLEVPQNSDLLYQDAYLGLRDKDRKFFFETYKDGNLMFIKEYNYSLHENGTTTNIILGDGLLIKKDGKFVPQYINCKTNGYAPTSVTGSFGKYIQGGEFRGNLKYDFIANQILGRFELINTKFKDFYVKTAKIFADKTTLEIKADGTYQQEKFECDVKAKNEFGGNIIVHSMDLFLDKLSIKHTESKQITTENNIVEIADKVCDYDITIENWNIKLNEINKDQIAVGNIELQGSLKDNVFKFTMNESGFADGVLTAAGGYNFKDGAADIDFAAKNINSNMVADIIFNLPGEVEGIADAKLKINTRGKLDDIKAFAEFNVEDGFLPKVGSTEFMIKNIKKVRVADLVNVDLTRKDAFQSNIKGTFNLNNSKIDDVRLTTQQKYLSLYIEGDYEIQEQNANLNLFGKYNKDAPKGVKILIIPLNWILKVVFRPEKSKDIYQTQIEQIPAIESANGKEKFFRVKMQGDLNNDKIKVEIKGIE